MSRANSFLWIVGMAALFVVPAFAQPDLDPNNTASEFKVYSPESQGVTPLSQAIDVDAEYPVEDTQESVGVLITSNEKVVFALDYNPGILWYDINMNRLQWPRDFEGNNMSAFYDDNGNPLPDGGFWGAKVKSNAYGPGFGLGGACNFGPESDVQIASLFDACVMGEIPCVQLYNNDGTPIVPVKCGISEALAKDYEGNVRIGDWDYLSNGNIVIAAECRKALGNSEVFGIAQSRVVTYGILAPGEQFPSIFARVSDYSQGNQEMWHGVASTKNGFAVRYSAGGAKITFFNNDGTRRSPEVDLTSLGTGAMAGVLAGGRGDHEGWHSDGVSRYILVSENSNLFGTLHPFVAIFDEDGNLIKGPFGVATGPDGYYYTTCDRNDCALHPSGKYIVVWIETDYLQLPSGGILLGRIFNEDGTPATKMFVIDNATNPDDPDSQPGLSRRPRVVWRGNKIAVVWVSTNRDEGGIQRVSGRTFQYGEETGIENYMIY